MRASGPGLALRIEFPPSFNELRARSAVWSHPGVQGPYAADGEPLAPQLRGITPETPLYGTSDPFGTGRSIRVSAVLGSRSLTYYLAGEDLAQYDLRCSTGFEGRARLWIERYLAEVVFAVHARCPIIHAECGVVSGPGARPAGGLALRATPDSGLEFIPRRAPPLDVGQVRDLVEKFMCADVPPARIEDAAEALEEDWVAEFGWELLPDNHPLARSWEILTVLTSLHDGGVLPEDGPAMLRLLDAPHEDALMAFAAWREYLQTVDPDARFERMCEVYLPD